MKEDTVQRQQHLSETTETNWKAIIGSLSDERNHWYDRAEMLKRQRDTAEEERDSWKVRAMKAEQREAARDEADRWKGKLVMAEEDREGWKERALKSEQQRQSLRDLLNIWEGQRDQAKIDAEHWKAEWALVMGQLGGARAEVEALRKYAGRWYEHITLRAAIDAALAVQPTTGDKHE